MFVNPTPVRGDRDIVKLIRTDIGSNSEPLEKLV
jgi:hypothetical protein